MLSDGKARPNASTEASGATKHVPETPDPKDNSAHGAKPGAGVRSAFAADETLAREALEGLKRIRAKARLDKMAISKPAPAVVRPAVIVAKPPALRPPWVMPLATLVVVVGLVVSACTGAIVYLTMQPSQTNVTASAEIRNLRETVSQLRKQLSGISEGLDGLRTTVDLSSKATNDRFGRFAENLDRIERVNSSSNAKLDRLAQAQAHISATAAATSQPRATATPAMPVVASSGDAPESTGSISQSERTSTRRKVVTGWSVRQVYEGIAILQGPSGVVEALLGQQVPGLGRIKEIRTESGEPVVLSSAGAILSARK